MTELCSNVDGFIAPKDDPVWNSITPPLHFSCRSQIRYITKVDVKEDNVVPSPAVSEDDLKKLRDLPGGKGFV